MCTYSEAFRKVHYVFFRRLVQGGVGKTAAENQKRSRLYYRPTNASVRDPHVLDRQQSTFYNSALMKRIKHKLDSIGIRTTRITRTTHLIVKSSTIDE